MSDDLDALLRDHYRRAAEGVQPDGELIDRLRNAGRPARAVPGWPRVLLAAAAVAAIALLTWGLLRPDHPVEPADHVVPVAPSPATTAPAAPAPSPRPSAVRPVPRPPRREPRPMSARPTPEPPHTRPAIPPATPPAAPHASPTRMSSSTPRPTGR